MFISSGDCVCVKVAGTVEVAALARTTTTATEEAPWGGEEAATLVGDLGPMAVSIWGCVAPEDFMVQGWGGGGGATATGARAPRLCELWPLDVAECNWLICSRVYVLKDVSFTDAQWLNSFSEECISTVLLWKDSWGGGGGGVEVDKHHSGSRWLFFSLWSPKEI